MSLRGTAVTKNPPIDLLLLDLGHDVRSECPRLALWGAVSLRLALSYEGDLCASQCRTSLPNRLRYRILMIPVSVNQMPSMLVLRGRSDVSPGRS